MFCLHRHLCAIRMHCPQKPAGGIGVSGTGITGGCELLYEVLGIEQRFSEKVARALNH